jgi:hypothetical protein
VYRYGSKSEQVLTIGPVSANERVNENAVTVDSEFTGGCSRCN